MPQLYSWDFVGRSRSAAPGGGSAGILLPFSTSFSGANEDPISEGGIWRHNPNNGWQTSRVRVTSGVARPDALSNQTGHFDDAYSLLDQTKFLGGIPNNVEVICTLDLGSGTTQEHEILLRAGDSDTTASAYECLYNAADGSAQIVRWDGALNSFTDITSSAINIGAGSTGNQIRATIVGSAITLYWRANSGNSWTQIAAATDTTFANGSVGISFYATAAGGGSIDACGFTDFTVSVI